MHTHERPQCELVLCQAGTLAALVSADSSCGWGEKVSDAKISHKEANTVKGLGGRGARGQTPRGAGVLMHARYLTKLDLSQISNSKCMAIMPSEYLGFLLTAVMRRPSQHPLGLSVLKRIYCHTSISVANSWLPPVRLCHLGKLLLALFS